MFSSLMTVATSENTSYGDIIQMSIKPRNKTRKMESPKPQQLPFLSDIVALTNKFGPLERGKEIELTLHEALELMPRKRERSDAYLKLQGYLLEERGITLTIKSKKNNGKKEKD